MPTPDDPNVATTPQGTSGSPDYQTLYTDLMGKINSGEFFTKAVYTGLQRVHETEINAHKATKGELLATQSQLKSMTDQIASLETGSKSVLEEKTSLSAQLESAQRKLKRDQLVMGKFPNLAQWEADGLLPDLPEDKLETALKAISEKLVATNMQARQTTIAGASALESTNTTTVEVNAAHLSAEAMTAARAGDMKTYTEKMDAYYKAVPKS